MRTSAFGILLLGLAAVFVIAAAIIIIYKRKVNKALKEEKSNAHMVLPAPADTLNIVVKVAVIALLVWIALTLRSLNEIKQDIVNMQSQNSNQIASLSYEINQLKSELETANSKVMKYNSEIVSVDTSDDTCIVRHTIMLKSFTDKTTVTLRTSDDREMPMEKTGEGIYIVDEKAGLFKAIMDDITVAISDGSESVIEPVSRYYGDIYRYSQLVIPELNASFQGLSHQDNTISFGDIILYSDLKALYTIDSAKIVIEQNGKEIKQEDVTEEVKKGLENKFGDVIISLNELYNVGKDESFKVTLCIKTSDGYELEQELFEKTTSNMFESFGNRYSIIGKDGKIK